MRGNHPRNGGIQRGDRAAAKKCREQKRKCATRCRKSWMRRGRQGKLRRRPLKTKLGTKSTAVNGYFAWLEARTIRRILRRQRCNQTRWSACRCHRTILPSRFEIIIDLNLEFFGGRDEARQWVKRAITEALRDCRVDDPGQTCMSRRAEIRTNTSSPRWRRRQSRGSRSWIHRGDRAGTVERGGGRRDGQLGKSQPARKVIEVNLPPERKAARMETIKKEPRNFARSTASGRTLRSRPESLVRFPRSRPTPRSIPSRRAAPISRGQ